MKAKKILLIILIALIGIGLWAVGYSALWYNDKRAVGEGWFEVVIGCIEEDQTFASQYGKIVSTEFHSPKDYHVVGEKKIQVFFLAVMDSGESYYMRVNCEFINEPYVLEYVEITPADK